MKDNKGKLDSDDFVEKISDNLYVHHISKNTKDKWNQERWTTDGVKNIYNKNGFHLRKHGRSGSIYYVENDKIAEFYYEMSGSDRFDILLSFDQSSNWIIPNDIQFTEDDKKRIKYELIEWLKENKIRAEL